jgi:putative membrane protein
MCVQVSVIFLRGCLMKRFFFAGLLMHIWQYKDAREDYACDQLRSRTCAVGKGHSFGAVPLKLGYAQVAESPGPALRLFIISKREKGAAMRWLLHWIVNAVVLLIVSHFVQGFNVSGFASAMFAVVIIGVVNATLGLFLKFMTFPLSLLTLGLFVFVIDAIVLWLSSKLVPGFSITGFMPALIAAFVLALIQMLLGFFGAEKKA